MVLKLLFSFIGLLVVLSQGATAQSVVVLEQQGKIGEMLSDQVSRFQQVLVTYNLSMQAPVLDDRTLTFDFSSDDARNDQPILISITSGATVQQVMLPQTVTTVPIRYSRTSVTLCLVNATLDLDTIVVVSVTANSSPVPLAFNMTAHIFENYTLSIGQSFSSITVAPASPLSYRFEFPPHSLHPEVDGVLVHVNSPDDRCSVLSVQRDACPVNNQEDDIKFRGTYQTFTRQAAITVSRTLFDTESFFIIITVLSSDEDCKPTLPTIAWHISNIRHDYQQVMTGDDVDPSPPMMPLVHSMPREKSISISLERVASQTDVVTGIAVALTVFVIVCIVCLTLTFTVTRKRLVLMVQEKEVRCQISPGEDERARLLRRRLMQVPQASSTPSGTGRNTNSNNNYGAIPEITIRTPRETNATQYVSAIADTPEQQAAREISPIGETSAVDEEEFETSSVDSSEYDKVPEVEYDKELIRTKPRLYVSDMAKKRPRDLSKKYSLYPWNLGIISFFYVLPVIQLVLAYQIAVNHLGNQDSCYYNFRCAIPVAGLTAFNNVFSNVAYVLLGILFIVIVRYHHHLLRDWEYRVPSGQHGRRDFPFVAETPTSPLTATSPGVSLRDPNVALGIPPLHGISYALGIALIMEGIMSACYHVCPNSSNFQFDTTYMYILSWLLIAKIYQTRHPDIGRNAHLFYFGIAIIIFLAMLGAVFGVNSILFYVLLCIVMIPMTIEISLYFYFMGSFKIDFSVFFRCFYAFHHMCASRSFKPSHPFRLVFVAVFNALNWGMAIFGVIAHPPDFDTFLLTISIANVMLYLVFYVLMKIRHKERIHPLTIMLILIATAFWVSALVFFVQHQTSWQLTPAGSRVLNQPCVLFNFFDAHDIWHFLSAFALFTSFLILLVIDDEVMLLPRDKISVF